MMPPADHGFAGRALRLGAMLLALAATLTVLLIAGVPGPDRARSALHALRPGSETRYSRYDPLLGWTSRPGLTVPDMYGPGGALTIDDQGFRHAGPVARDPAPRRRVLCLGDSFTFGLGVGDADTWCERLAAADPSVETVNMGESGYGVDQAFLRYRRDAAGLRHDLVLFAFIANDFDRMRSARYDGYPKPTLRLTDGALRAAHVPVPRGIGIRGRLERALLALERSRGADAGTGGGDRPATRPAPDPDRDPEDTLVTAVVGELDTLAGARGARVLLVQLPTRNDYRGGDADHWRRTLPLTARHAGVTWVDLIPALRRLPAESVSALFIPRDGHYSATGHAWVARRLRPFVAAALAVLRPSRR